MKPPRGWRTPPFCGPSWVPEGTGGGPREQEGPHKQELPGLSECPAPAHPVTLRPWSWFLWSLPTPKLPASMLPPPPAVPGPTGPTRLHAGCWAVTLSGAQTRCPLERTVTQSQGVCAFLVPAAVGAGRLHWLGAELPPAPSLPHPLVCTGGGGGVRGQVPRD